jgi:putative endonuclease
MTARRLALGSAGEQAAEAHLRKLGFKIIARNLRLGRTGELDLVAMDGTVLVFAEVKTRIAGQDLGGFENITYAKQRKLTALAEAYLQRHKGPYTGARFDAIEVEFAADAQSGKPTAVRHLPDAFRAI